MLVACSSGGGKKTATTNAGAGKLAAETASFDLAVGPPARYLVGVLTQDQRGVSYGTAAVRFCFLGFPKATGPCQYGESHTASFIAVPGSPPAPANAGPQVVSPSQAKGVYATDVGFDKAGFWRVEVSVDLDGKKQQTTTDFQVLDKHAVPAPGDAAIPSQNLTVSTPGVAPASVDSRAVAGGLIPDPELHQATIASALAAHRPVVAVFATPVYCVSRFCGPVTDMVDQLAKAYGDRATFVHVEIWKDFQKQEANQAALEWLYRNDTVNEPWVFLVGADGKIAARWDNVVTREAVEPMLQVLPTNVNRPG